VLINANLLFPALGGTSTRKAFGGAGPSSAGASPSGNSFNLSNFSYEKSFSVSIERHYRMNRLEKEKSINYLWDFRH
jgi:hypothetical protein